MLQQGISLPKTNIELQSIAREMSLLTIHPTPTLDNSSLLSKERIVQWGNASL